MQKYKIFFIREIQILKRQCIEICESNNPHASGGRGYNTCPSGEESESGAGSGVHRRDTFPLFRIKTVK